MLQLVVLVHEVYFAILELLRNGFGNIEPFQKTIGQMLKKINLNLFRGGSSISVCKYNLPESDTSCFPLLRDLSKMLVLGRITGVGEGW